MKLLDAKRWLVPLRRLSLVLAFVGGLYLWKRYAVLPLPESGCSPLLSLRPGTRLWIDRRPSRLSVGDVLFYEVPDGSLSFGRCTQVDGERYWVAGNAHLCPTLDSDELGWLTRADIRARLVMAFGN